MTCIPPVEASSGQKMYYFRSPLGQADLQSDVSSCRDILWPRVVLGGSS